MTLMLLILVLAVAWAAITGNFSGLNMLFGAGVATVAVLLLRQSFAPPLLLRRLRRTLALLALFLKELIISAVRVAIVVMTPDLRSTLRPAIVAFPLTVKSDAEITLLANLITLTPGTLTVDVADDRSVLYVHALTLSSREALIADIAGGFEARIREVFA